MKILFLSAAKSIHTVKWVNALVERGNTVYLVYNRGHEPKEDLLNKKVQSFELKYSGNIGYYLNARELKKLSKMLKPDIINVHYASGYGTLARRAKIGPILLSVWGSDVYDFPYESGLKNRILKKNIQYAKALASTSYCMADQLRKVMGNQNLEIAVTPFGVDIQKFCPECYPQKKDREEIIIGNIKLLEAKYGITELVMAFAQLKSKIESKSEKKLKLYIYGDGSQKEDIEQLICTLNLQEYVCLKGRIPNAKVPEVLGELDIFCALSQNESFGVAVVEAMAMGKPVVVSDVDGFREVVEDNKTGFIVQREDIEAVVTKLEELVLNEELRNKLGAAGRKRVEEKYAWEKNVDMMLELYQKFEG